MTNAQKVGGLAMMTVFLGLLIFVRTMWESGRLTYALLGLVVAIVLLGLVIAYWRNAEAVLDFFRAIPGWVSDFLSEYWAHLIGLVLVAGMIWVGGGMLFKAAKVSVGYESVMTTPIASPTSSTATTSAPRSMGDIFVGEADTFVVSKGGPASYRLGYDEAAEFTPQGDRDLINTWEVKTSSYTDRFYAFKAGIDLPIDSMVIRVCKHPKAIEIARCVW